MLYKLKFALIDSEDRVSYKSESIEAPSFDEAVDMLSDKHIGHLVRDVKLDS